MAAPQIGQHDKVLKAIKKIHEEAGIKSGVWVTPLAVLIVGFDEVDKYSEGRVQNMLTNLRQWKLVRLRVINGQQYFKLTKKGRDKLWGSK